MPSRKSFDLHILWFSRSVCVFLYTKTLFSHRIVKIFAINRVAISSANISTLVTIFSLMNYRRISNDLHILIYSIYTFSGDNWILTSFTVAQIHWKIKFCRNGKCWGYEFIIPWTGNIKCAIKFLKRRKKRRRLYKLFV